MKNLRKLSWILVICLINSILVVGCASKESEALDEKQKLLVYGAVLSSRNNMSFNELKTIKKGSEDVLKDGWGVTNKETAIETLEWLANEGHRKDVDEVYKVIKDGEGGNYPQLNNIIKLYNKANSTMKDKLGFKDESFNNVTTVAAWDTDRLVTVARWIYSAGYITEEEAWQYINKAVSIAQSSFNSWEEYFISCAYGRAIAYEGDIDDIIDTGETLLKGSNSVWKKCDFK